MLEKYRHTLSYENLQTFRIIPTLFLAACYFLAGFTLEPGETGQEITLADQILAHGCISQLGASSHAEISVKGFLSTPFHPFIPFACGTTGNFMETRLFHAHSGLLGPLRLSCCLSLRNGPASSAKCKVSIPAEFPEAASSALSGSENLNARVGKNSEAGSAL